ncbi:MAG: RsmE family RNA methyltransferase [bacterium]
MKHRIYVPPLRGDSITDPATVHRIRNVLRLKEGDCFTGFDGVMEYTLRVTEMGRDAVRVSRDGERSAAPPPVRLTIAQALLKGRRWDIFLEKTTEIGVWRIVPLETANTVVRLRRDEVGKKLERWRGIVRGAGAQCRGGWVPEISPPVDFAAYVGAPPAEGARLILTPGAGVATLTEALGSPAPAEVTIAVGPEGDFTPEEAGAAREAGFVPVSLGGRVLRSETAAIAAAALTLLGERPRR